MNLGLPLAIISTAFRYPALRQVLVTIGMAIIAILALQDSMPSTPAIIRVLVATLFLSVVTTSWQAANETETLDDQFMFRAFGGAAAGVAIVISAFGTIFSGLVLAALVLILTSLISRERPFVAANLSLVAVPMWVWMTLDHWRWSLLLLLPMIALALVTTSHLIDSYSWPDDEERLLPARAHRYAAWTATAFCGVLMVSAGLLFGLNHAWLALAGITLAIIVPLEAGLVTTEGPLKRSLRIVSSAYLVAVVCWLMATG